MGQKIAIGPRRAGEQEANVHKIETRVGGARAGGERTRLPVWVNLDGRDRVARVIWRVAIDRVGVEHEHHLVGRHGGRAEPAGGLARPAGPGGGTHCGLPDGEHMSWRCERRGRMDKYNRLNVSE